MEALVLDIDNLLIPVEISCNEMHKYISTGYSETIIIKYLYLKGILNFNCIWLIHAFMLHIFTHAQLLICTYVHMHKQMRAHTTIPTCSHVK